MKDQDILTKVNHKDGMTTPEGFFDDFAARMEASLPQREFEREDDSVISLPRTFWQRVRPFVYMAAMFAGIWCMLKMFDLMAPSHSMNPDTNPTLAAAISDDRYMNDYFSNESDVTDYDLMDDLYETGFELPEDSEDSRDI